MEMIEINFYVICQTAVSRSRWCVWFQPYKASKSQVVKILSSENARQLLITGIH